MNDGNDAAEQSPEWHRAEQVVDAAGRSIADFISRVTSQVVKSAALAREEAEDVIAEARNVNQNQQS